MVNGKEYVLTLNDQDMGVLQNALLELPYRAVAPLIAKIQAQLSPSFVEESETDPVGGAAK